MYKVVERKMLTHATTFIYKFDISSKLDLKLYKRLIKIYILDFYYLQHHG